MLSIGEIAQSTGVSRRMLRHWEDEGLLTPAAVDTATGYRRYRESQLGRVRAIASLRELGFGLEEVRHLLDPRIAQDGLESVLAGRAEALRELIAEASTRLLHVQRRLDDIRHRTEEIAMNLTITALPAVELWGLSAAVLDETEIGRAVRDLSARVPSTDGEQIRLYDGTGDDRITVSVGTTVRPDDSAGAHRIAVAAAPQGVSAVFDGPLADVGDAWVVIDAALADRGLIAFGVYRQLIGRDGSTTLQAPVRERG